MSDLATPDYGIMGQSGDPPITWDGKPLTPKRIVDAWLFASSLMQKYRDEVRRCRNLRRGTLIRDLPPSWKTKNPEAAAAAIVRLSERRTLEQDLKSRLGEPRFERKALGDLHSDEIAAAEFEDYLNEWRTSVFGVPFQAFKNKAVEDGGFLRVRLPASLDIEGRPDFFVRLNAAAYESLDPEEKKAFKHDPAFKKKPYVRVDEHGTPQPNPKWDRNPDGLTRRKVESTGGQFERSDSKSRSAHDLAVQSYLLSRPADTCQVFGGLDAAPIFKRGMGQEQAELAAAVTRQLITVAEALDMDYGWKGMNGRVQVPRGESDTNTVGRSGCYYLYTMFLTSRDKQGHVHPLIAYTIGGYGTTYGDGGMEPQSKDVVGLIDLYKEYGLEKPKWSWHWGLQTGDDEAAYRGRPYLSDLVDTILGIEGEESAIRAATYVNSFTGHVEPLGDALSGPSAEAVLGAVLETGGKTIKRGVIPAAGDIERSIGPIVPFQQARVGDDAYKVLANDRQALAQATAVDQAAGAPGASGHALVVGETLAKNSKIDIRASILEATRRDGEDHAEILEAIEDKHGIRWPIQKVEEPPAADVQSTEKYTIAEFDPDWVGDGRFTRLSCKYPAEENLAELDLEANFADRDYSHFEAVMEKKGIEDAEREWLKVLKWKARRHPLYIDTIMMDLAQRRGDKTMVEILKQLQAGNKITQAGVPGAENGVPTAALRRPGETAPGQGAPTAAAAQRGGIQAGEMQTASLQHDALGQIAARTSGGP